MNIRPDWAENNLIDAEIVRRDALDDCRAGIPESIARLQVAEALLQQRRTEFDAAFLAFLSVAA